jgi:peptide/nickel transport system permease protein
VRVVRIALARTLHALIVILVVVSLTFFFVHLAPGDPFTAALENPNVTEAVRQRWRAAYGLDQPLPVQYVSYIAAVARGELGWSLTMHRPVSELLAAAVPKTLLLTGTALLLSLAIGIGVAVLQARRAGSWVDRALSGVSLLVYSLPAFWLALMLLLTFSLWLGLFPVGGAADPLAPYGANALRSAVDTLRHLVLPATVLTLIGSAVFARYQRGALLDVLPADFIRTARAKGAPEKFVLRRHALRNALLPTITLLGLSIPTLLGGAVFVEKIFAWPGMGLLAVNAVATRDYAVVTAVALVTGLGVVVGNLLADILYAIADPRVRDG